MIDYPGKICCVVFLDRCNFKCPFCHNPELVFPHLSDQFPDITPEEFFSFLDKKKKWLDGVCITGGEPTLHKGLSEFIEEIKKRGLLVKLDTNGTNPGLVEKLISEKLVDFIAMDIKNTLEKYPKTVNSRVNLKDIKKSIDMIRDAGSKGLIDYEFRTTLLPRYHAKEDIADIGKMLKDSKRYVLQNFK